MVQTRPRLQFSGKEIECQHHYNKCVKIKHKTEDSACCADSTGFYNVYCIGNKISLQEKIGQNLYSIRTNTRKIKMYSIDTHIN